METIYLLMDKENAVIYLILINLVTCSYVAIVLEQF